MTKEAPQNTHPELNEQIKSADKKKQPPNGEHAKEDLTRQKAIENQLIKQLRETEAEPKPAKKRSHKITTPCNDIEEARIKANAAAMGLSLSDFVRQSTVTNLLLERRSNDLRDASLDMIGQLRCALTPALAALQSIARDLEAGELRDTIIGAATRVSDAIDRLNRREHQLCY